MKSWADHCSSDDEDDLQERTQSLQLPPEEAAALAHQVPSGDEYHRTDVAEEGGGGGDGPPHEHGQRPQREHHHSKQQNRGPRTYEFPTQPPYTAFVGNVSFQIQEPSDLASQLVDVARDVLQLDLVVTDSRIMRQRGEATKHRGFAYVQVETLDMLKALMRLNDVEGGAILAGRRVQVDTAQRSNNHNQSNNSRRPSSEQAVDGSKFQGGRFRNSKGGGGGGFGGGGAGPPFQRRGDPSASNSSEGEEGSGGPPQPPPQRQSLKLQPRSKQRDEAAGRGDPTAGDSDANRRTSASSIFGSGRARDEASWRERRHTTEAPAPDADKGNSKDAPPPPSVDSAAPVAAPTDRRQGGKSQHSGGRGGDEGERIGLPRTIGGRGSGAPGEGRGHGRPGVDERRSAGRGGRGGDRSHPSQQTAHPPNLAKKTSEPRERKSPSQSKATPASQPAAPPAEFEKPNAVNKFAALMLDESDSD